MGRSASWLVAALLFLWAANAVFGQGPASDPPSASFDDNGITPISPPAEFKEGIPVPGLPHLIRSPHVENEGKLIDVSGIKAGQKARCPYSGKVIIVPDLSHIVAEEGVGIPVPGLPDLIRSPHVEAEDKLIDVSGFKVGEMVRCPYSGKIVIVPDLSGVVREDDKSKLPEFTVKPPAKVSPEEDDAELPLFEGELPAYDGFNSIQIEGGESTFFDPEAEVVVISGSAEVIVQKRVTLLGDNIKFNLRSGQFEATGNATITKGDEKITGEQIRYNAKTGKIDSEAEPDGAPAAPSPDE